MRLEPGTYFGTPLRGRRCDGLRLTLSAYGRGGPQPWHCHANPTLFLVVAGAPRDYSRRGAYAQASFTFVYHPTTHEHAGEPGPGGLRGLNLEYEPGWLERHALSEADLAAHRPLDSA